MITEVKPYCAGLVLEWVTTWEYPVLWASSLLSFFVEFFYHYWAARQAQSQIWFSVVCGEKRPPRGGKTRGSCTEKRCFHKWFHMIFPCTEPCTDTFYTSSPLPLKNPQGVANLKKAICIVRSDSIIGVTL